MIGRSGEGLDFSSKDQQPFQLSHESYTHTHARKHGRTYGRTHACTRKRAHTHAVATGITATTVGL